MERSLAQASLKALFKFSGGKEPFYLYQLERKVVQQQRESLKKIMKNQNAVKRMMTHGLVIVWERLQAMPLAVFFSTSLKKRDR